MDKLTLTVTRDWETTDKITDLLDNHPGIIYTKKVNTNVGNITLEIEIYNPTKDNLKVIEEIINTKPAKPKPEPNLPSLSAEQARVPSLSSLQQARVPSLPARSQTRPLLLPASERKLPIRKRGKPLSFRPSTEESEHIEFPELDIPELISPRRNYRSKNVPKE